MWLAAKMLFLGSRKSIFDGVDSVFIYKYIQIFPMMHASKWLTRVCYSRNLFIDTESSVIVQAASYAHPRVLR